MNKEITERTEEDKTLQTNIDTETSTRITADKDLQDQIDKEVTERIERDKALQVNIDTEVSARTVADQQLQDQLSKEVTERIEGDKTLQTNIDVLKNEVSLLAFPVGGIIAWNGSAASIPSGWSLCDGTNGTPNLGNRFILGAGDKYKVGQTGGEEAHILTVAEMPAHNHTFKAPYDQAGMDVGTDKSGGQRQRLCCGDNPPYGNILYTGELNLAGESQPHTNMPPYYALAYIMKVA
jgi:microcystin-dependent protein